MQIFSIVYTTVLQLSSWLNLQLGKNTERNCLHGGPNIYVDFQLCRGSVLYPRVVQGSAVLIKLNLHQKNFTLKWGLLARRALIGSAPETLVAQTIKNLPAVRETQVQPLSLEDPLEKEILPTLVFLPGESHGQRSLAGYSP